MPENKEQKKSYIQNFRDGAKAVYLSKVAPHYEEGMTNEELEKKLKEVGVLEDTWTFIYTVEDVKEFLAYCAEEKN